MIQEFSVENYRSINTKQTLSFLAPDNIQEKDEYLSIEINDSVRLLKLCVLYGMNPPRRKQRGINPINLIQQDRE